MMTVSCIVPAYNEAKRLPAVLESLARVTRINEIVVVDDGSSDGTGDAARRSAATHAQIRVVAHPENRGKSAAVATGIRSATGTLILLVDADLLGLTAGAIEALIEPVASGTATMSMSLRGNAPRLFRSIGIDYLSGERCFERSFILPHLDALASLPSFGLEVFLNRIAIHARIRIAIVSWPGIRSPYKFEKVGLLAGIRADIAMARDVLQVVTLSETLQQIAALRRAAAKVPPPLPRLSIVVPAYNEEAYLAPCLTAIERAVALSGQSVEVLVVDNASTDGTAAVAGSFTGVRVVPETRKGLTRARQAGLTAATGDIVAYVDADTQMPDDWVLRVLQVFADEPETVCVSGPYRYVDVPAAVAIGTSLYWNLLAMPTYWAVGYMAVGGNFAVRRTTMLAVGGFDETIAFYGEDTDLARRIATAGRVRFIRSLVMPTSGRRLNVEGPLVTAARYVSNFIAVVRGKRPITEEYQDIR